MLWLLLIACAPQVTLDPPITQAADPAEDSAPVGVSTVSIAGLRATYWYPTTDDATGDPDVVDLLDYVPESFRTAISGITVPTIPSTAITNAPMRHSETPWPVVIFSHGFGGFSAQSVSLTAHLASRGYVVIAPEHDSRSIGALAPCLLSSTADECNVGMSFDPSVRDPALDDVDAALAFLDRQVEGDWAGAVDADTVGIFGHSAGGGTTTGAANENPRFLAAMAMAGAGELTVSTPSTVIGGNCDGIVPEAGEGGLAASGATSTEGYWSLAGGGHMAFADLCKLDLGTVGAQIKELDGSIGFFIDQMLGLATDGCAGFFPSPDLACGESYLDLAVSDPILRASVTLFFDQHLKASGEGMATLQAPELAQP